MASRKAQRQRRQPHSNQDQTERYTVTLSHRHGKKRTSVGVKGVYVPYDHENRLSLHFVIMGGCAKYLCAKLIGLAESTTGLDIYLKLQTPDSRIFRQLWVQQEVTPVE